MFNTHDFTPIVQERLRTDFSKTTKNEDSMKIIIEQNPNKTFRYYVVLSHEANNDPSVEYLSLGACMNDAQDDFVKVINGQ